MQIIKTAGHIVILDRNDLTIAIKDYVRKQDPCLEVVEPTIDFRCRDRSSELITSCKLHAVEEQ